MSDNENQDELMHLPATLTLSKFTAARSTEIKVMKKLLSTTTGVKLAFQKLPKHMRRRAMSHNVKRLPRRLREIHMNQMKKSGLPPKQKRPSRKYRRRPYNLTSDYMRRQRRCKWLNTHIWHAKRFHMVEKWGYKLPNASCDRSFRACYRATVNHCLLQDLSYYSCIEIKGNYDVIVEGFRKITNKNHGLTIEAKAYVSGLRNGNVTLFRYDNKKAIGIANFLWRPANEEGNRMLWLWLHPSFHGEVLEMLIHCFNFVLNGKSYINNDNLELTLRSNEINRFRLTGKLSNLVIHNTFKLVEKSSEKWVKNNENCIDPILLEYSKEHWEYFKCMVPPSIFSPHIAIPFIVLDPRFNLPKTRTKNLPVKSVSTGIPILTKPVDSPLWKSDVRKIVEANKITNSKIAEMRQNLLVPGSDSEHLPVPIPIILLHRPGVRTSENNGYGSGWDLIFPAKWAQPFWISLIMWGARAGGLRETNSISFESNEQCFLYPDTAAGHAEEQQLTLKCKEDFYKLPPNKRTNFNKFHISSPFELNWSLLTKEWQDSEQHNSDYLVLRNRKELQKLQENLKSKVPSVPEMKGNYLIPVRISLSTKGSCKPFSIICLPIEKDYKIEPVEPDHCDPNEKMRKELRRQHKMLLKRLRRRRKRASSIDKDLHADQEMLKEYRTKMRKLWLPETTKIRESCSREVIGFVKYGDFSFVLGRTKGIGYIVSGALTTLLSRKYKDKILIRNTNSKQYRIGILDIIYE